MSEIPNFPEMTDSSKIYVLILRSACSPDGSQILGAFDTLALANRQWMDLVPHSDKEWLTSERIDFDEDDLSVGLHLKYPEVFDSVYIGLVNDPVELEENCIYVQEVKRVQFTTTTVSHTPTTLPPI